VLHAQGRRVVEAAGSAGSQLPHGRVPAVPPYELEGSAAGGSSGLHLELARKALSHNFASVQGLADAAAPKATQRFAQARDDVAEPRHMPDDQEHQHVKSLKATEDMHERCGDVAAFLARSDVVPRVTQACRVLDCFVVVKRALHARAGEKWRRRCLARCLDKQLQMAHSEEASVAAPDEAGVTAPDEAGPGEAGVAASDEAGVAAPAEAGVAAPG